MFTFNKGYLEKVWSARTGLFHVKQGYLWQKNEILGSNNIAITASGSCSIQGSTVSNQTSSYNIVSITAEGNSSLSSSSKYRVPNTIERKSFVLNKGLLVRSWTGNKGLVLKQGALWQNIETEQPETVICSGSGSIYVSGEAQLEQYHFSKTKHACTAKGASVTYGNAETYKYISILTPPGRFFFKDGLLHKYTSGASYYGISFAFDNGLLYKSELLRKEHPVTVVTLGASGQATTSGTADLSYWEIPKLVATAAGHSITYCDPIDVHVPHWSTVSGHATISISVSEPQIVGYTVASGLISLSGNANLNAVYDIKAFGYIFSGIIERGKDDPDYPTTWHYVNVTGNDNTGDGTVEKPYATVKKALQAASSGHGIRILPGNYRLSPIELGTLAVVGLYDYGKKLYIEGYDNETILSFYGSDSYQRDANLMQLNNSGTVVSNITFHYYPNRPYSYSNAVFRWVYGRVRNCWIENKSSTNMSMHYHNNSPDGTLKVYNCIIKSNGNYTGDYYDQTGLPLYVNCLFDFTPRGTKEYCIVRTITANDANLADLPADIRTLGDPSILNPNGTRSHIGVCGGPYGWGHHFRSVAILTIKYKVTSLSGKATTFSDKATALIVKNVGLVASASGYSVLTCAVRSNTKYGIKSATGKVKVFVPKTFTYMRYGLTASSHSVLVNWWTHRGTAKASAITSGLLSGGELRHCEIAFAEATAKIYIDSSIITVLPCASKAVSRLIGNAHNNFFFRTNSKTGKASLSKNRALASIYRFVTITSKTGLIKTAGRARIPPPNEHVAKGNGRIRTYPYCIVDMDYYLYILGYRRVHWLPTNGASYYNVYRSDYPGQSYYKIGTAPHQKRPHYKISMDLRPCNLTATRVSEGVKLNWDNPIFDGYPITIKPVPVGSDSIQKYSPSEDVMWMDDSLPDGALWVDQTGAETSSFKRHGNSSLKVTATNGYVEPKFTGANTPIPPSYIIVWVYIDRDEVPDSFWISFYDDQSWEHRYYWGKDRCPFGEIGTESRLYLEELPTPGLWTPLTFHTEGINTSNISGMGFGVDKENGTGTIYIDSVYYTDQYVTKMDCPHMGLLPDEPFIVKKEDKHVLKTDQTEYLDTNVINVHGFTNTSLKPIYKFERHQILDKVTISWGIPDSLGTTYTYSVSSIDMCGVRSEPVIAQISINDSYSGTDITISSASVPEFTVTVEGSTYEHDVIPGETYHYKFETKDGEGTTINTTEIDYEVPLGPVLGNFILGKSVLC